MYSGRGLTLRGRCPCRPRETVSVLPPLPHIGRECARQGVAEGDYLLGAGLRDWGERGASVRGRGRPQRAKELTLADDLLRGRVGDGAGRLADRLVELVVDEYSSRERGALDLVALGEGEVGLGDGHTVEAGRNVSVSFVCNSDCRGTASVSTIAGRSGGSEGSMQGEEERERGRSGEKMWGKRVRRSRRRRGVGRGYDTVGRNGVQLWQREGGRREGCRPCGGKWG
jgi:hypothetical protein